MHNLKASLLYLRLCLSVDHSGLPGSRSIRARAHPALQTHSHPSHVAAAPTCMERYWPENVKPQLGAHCPVPRGRAKRDALGTVTRQTRFVLAQTTAGGPGQGSGHSCSARPSRLKAPGCCSPEKPISSPAPAPAFTPYFPSPSRATLHHQAGLAFLLQASFQEDFNGDYQSQEDMDFSLGSCNPTLTRWWLREE